ncbi:triacylglycerol lipase [Pseudomonas sp. GD03944]|uniref:lipase family alpha/beta hydrolase n=1 Tax=Pseudomonas sp. GD03944 TaxID=2975409 RepID=UPI00244A8FB6|nr:triacylglycerol lipase [Pseudomonas sp. GD03944]MDH1265579.1 triacylglycerol lipase [Pseudomonas sp. GD03944]
MSTTAGPRYPLVLVPGLLGFVRLLGYPYWYGIVSALRRQGATVFPVLVSSVNSTEVRGEQLLAHIARVREQSGAAKVHLIGHSQGALTARYAAALRPEWVASVTSVAGPNHGSELADYLARRAPHGSLRERLLSALLRGVARCMAWLETGDKGPALPMDVAAAQQSLTCEGVAAFNVRYPQGLPDTWGGQGAAEVNGVRYYSWSGTLQPGVTNRGGNRLDGPNLACRLFARTFRREAGHCDGMVGRYSSHLGTVIGDDYPLDHFDIVNQTFGLVGKGVRPVELFLEHARRLREAGL